MQAQVVSIALLLAIVAGRDAPSPAAAASPADDDGADAPPPQSDLTCEELCKKARGLGKSDCLTECQTFEQTAPNKDEALGDFVHDVSHNEASGQGGEAMEETYEDATGQDVPDCTPSVEGKPTFEDIDADGNGLITAEEAISYGHKMCVSDEMVMQMFAKADADRDKEVTPAEFNSVGEEHAAEQVVDAAADPVTEGDQEYNEVHTPHFEEFDKDGDEVLSGDEIREVLVFELHRRYPGKSKEEIDDIAEKSIKNLAEALPDVDTNGDGEISKDEWYAEPAESTDMGDELGEVADDDKNAKDPDDLPVAEESESEAPAAAPAASPALFFHARVPSSSALTRHHGAAPHSRRGGQGALGRHRNRKAPGRQEFNWRLLNMLEKHHLAPRPHPSGRAVTEERRHHLMALAAVRRAMAARHHGHHRQRARHHAAHARHHARSQSTEHSHRNLRRHHRRA